jgi:adenine/guanine phosphoribosyltransferase-like PRPP-binding protein
MACFLAVLASSIINVGHELVLHDFHVSPSDLVFWIPGLLAIGVAFAMPIAILTGVPFYCVRRPRSIA